MSPTPLTRLSARLPARAVPSVSVELPSNMRPIGPRRFFVISMLAVLGWTAVACALGACFSLALGLGFAALGLGVLVRKMRGLGSLVRCYEDALGRFDSGQDREAERTFAELCTRTRGWPPLQALFLSSLGHAHAMRRDVDGAIAHYRAALDSGWIKPSGALATHWPVITASLAFAEAMRGDVASAERLLADAHAHISEARRGVLLFIDVFVEASCGRPDRVLARIAEQGEHAAALLTSRQNRAIRLFEAFALHAGGSGRASAHTLRQAIEAARGPRRGEFDHLAAHWPELHEFLTLHDLCAPPRATRAQFVRRTSTRSSLFE